MQVNEYQVFANSTAMFTNNLKTKQDQILYCMLGLVGETGEVAEKFKKKLRSGGNLEEFVSDADIAKELGDIAWYWVELCELLGWHASTVLKMNIDKLKSRQERGVINGKGDNR